MSFRNEKFGLWNNKGHNCKEQMDSKINFDAISNNSVYFIILSAYLQYSDIIRLQKQASFG